MKRCKKLLCLVLALVMALSLCTVAMADDPVTTTVENLTEVVIPVVNYKYGWDILNSDDLQTIKWKTTSSTELSSLSVMIIEDVMLCDSGDATNATSDRCLKADKDYYLKLKLVGPTDRSYCFVAATTSTIAEANPGTAFKFTVNGGAAGEVQSANVNENNNAVAVVIKLDKLGVDNYTAKIPFTKVVELGGNTEPAAKRFELEWKNKPVSLSGTTIEGGDQGNETADDPANHVNVTGYVDTNGAGTYTGNIYVTGPKYYVDRFMMQCDIYVSEKNDGAAGWDYDDQMWLVKNENWRSDGTYETVFIKVSGLDYTCTHGDADRGNNTTTLPADHLTAMTLTNTYTENVAAPTHETIHRQHTTPAPEAPATQPVASPKTGDMGVALYAAMALLSMSGSAVILGKKRSK